jgi:oligoribonuclease
MSQEKKERVLDTILLWLDLEMTGLDPQKDTILEIASIITDNDLNYVAQGPSLVIHQPDAVLDTMNEWSLKQHTKSGLLDLSRKDSVTMQKAEQDTLYFVQAHCPKWKAILCGNSIHNDQTFLRFHMPRLFEYLHYRLVDVSSVKELLKRWYPNNPYLDFKKTDQHRALIDTEESIAELRHYRNHFFIPQTVSHTTE